MYTSRETPVGFRSSYGWLESGGQVSDSSPLDCGPRDSRGLCVALCCFGR